jgi:CheY-like chemotaxis protein
MFIAGRKVTIYWSKTMTYLKDHLVLVVDDEPDLREMLVSELQSIDTKTREAKNGKEGIHIVKSEKIDLIISDVRMPGGNGIELLDETKKLNLRKPIFLFITAFSDVTREEIHAHGAEGLISKPFDLPDLIKNLEWLCSPSHERYALKPTSPIETEIKINQDPNEKTPFLMGRGGALIPTGKNLLEAGIYIQLDITFLNGNKIIGIAEVLWNGNSNTNGEYCAGVEFKYFNDETRGFAIETLEKCNSIAYVPERSEKFDS